MECTAEQTDTGRMYHPLNVNILYIHNQRSRPFDGTVEMYLYTPAGAACAKSHVFY